MCEQNICPIESVERKIKETFNGELISYKVGRSVDIYNKLGDDEKEFIDFTFDKITDFVLKNVNKVFSEEEDLVRRMNDCINTGSEYLYFESKNIDKFDYGAICNEFTGNDKIAKQKYVSILNNFSDGSMMIMIELKRQ